MSTVHDFFRVNSFYFVLLLLLFLNGDLFPPAAVLHQGWVSDPLGRVWAPAGWGTALRVLKAPQGSQGTS